MKEEALKLIRKIRVASKDHYNDGWVMAGYRDDLKEIYDVLGKFLIDNSASGDGAVKENKLDLMG